MLQQVKHIQWAIVITLFIAAIFVQFNLYGHWDVLCILDVTKRFFHGGIYSHNLFSIDPPMIFYLNIIPIWLAQILHVNAMSMFRVMIFVIAGYSLMMSQYLIAKIIPPSDSVSRILFIVSLSFGYLIFPVLNFGQREHIMIMLVFPYFLLMAWRMQDNHSSNISKKTIWIIAILAAIGFSIKPYFLLALVFVELYFMWHKKMLFSWLRIETLIILFFLFVYVALIFFLMPVYLTVTLPFIIHFYLTSYLAQSLSSFYYFTAFFLIATGFYFFSSRKPCHLNNILWLASLGFLLAYFFQRKGWAYHALPMMITSLVLLNLLMAPGIAQIIKKPMTLNLTAINASIMIVVLLVIMVINPSVLATINEIKDRSDSTSKVNQLISYVKKHGQGRPIYFFSTSISESSVVTVYTNSLFASRLPVLWPIPQIANLQKMQRNNQLDNKGQAILNRARDLLRSIMIEDFNHYHPYLVFVDVSSPKPFLKEPFDYISFFSEDGKFKAIWKKYQYVGRSRQYEIFKLG